MPIALTCPSCARRFKIKDGLGGKKVKCPECGKAVPVPESDEADENGAGPAAPPRRSSRAPVDDEAERPRKKRRRDDEDEGDEDRPRRRSRARDEDDEYDDRPRKKKKKSSLGLVIGLCAGGVGLVVVAVVLLMVFGVFGGGGPRRNITVENELKVIGLAYHTMFETTRKAPANAQELRPFLEKDSFTASQKLEAGMYVFIWNIPPPRMADGSSNSILAYEPSAPAQGGAVLFGDGSVRTLSAEQFQKSPKARLAIVNPPK